LENAEWNSEAEGLAVLRLMINEYFVGY